MGKDMEKKKGKGKAAQAQAAPAAAPAPAKKEAAPAAFPEGFDTDPISFLIHPQVRGARSNIRDRISVGIKNGRNIYHIFVLPLGCIHFHLAASLHLRHCNITEAFRSGILLR
jgi:hypothetical protein